MIGYGVVPYLGLNEIKSLNPIMNFITIRYLFNYIFLDLSVITFGFIYYDFLLVPINNTLCYCF